jgi:hypothetical protein
LRVSGIVSFAPSQRKRVLLDLTAGSDNDRSFRRKFLEAKSIRLGIAHQAGHEPSDALCADPACEGQV